MFGKPLRIKESQRSVWMDEMIKFKKEKAENLLKPPVDEVKESKKNKNKGKDTLFWCIPNFGASKGKNKDDEKKELKEAKKRIISNCIEIYNASKGIKAN